MQTRYRFIPRCKLLREQRAARKSYVLAAQRAEQRAARHLQRLCERFPLPLAGIPPPRSFFNPPPQVWEILQHDWRRSLAIK